MSSRVLQPKPEDPQRKIHFLNVANLCCLDAVLRLLEEELDNTIVFAQGVAVIPGSQERCKCMGQSLALLPLASRTAKLRSVVGDVSSWVSHITADAVSRYRCIVWDLYAFCC